MTKTNNIQKSVLALVNHQPKNSDEGRLAIKILISAFSGCRFKQLYSANAFKDGRIWIAQVDSKTSQSTGNFVPIVVPKFVIKLMDRLAVRPTDLYLKKDFEKDANSLLKTLDVPASEVVSIEEIPLFGKYFMGRQFQKVLDDQRLLWSSKKFDPLMLQRVISLNSLDKFSMPLSVH